VWSIAPPPSSPAHPWTLRGGGQYVFGVVNPKDAPGPACATVKFGRINWSDRFNK
jgi:hypothetical protein